MDQTITQWINAPASGNVLLDSIMVMATQFGVPLLVLLVVLQWWSRHDRLHVRHTCAAAGLSFLVGVALNQVILLFVHRVRPYDAGVTHLIISRSGDWSFPSDHATVTFAIAATSCFMACESGRSAFWLAPCWFAHRGSMSELIMSPTC